jgi:anti-sigma B factor antagonist
MSAGTSSANFEIYLGGREEVYIILSGRIILEDCEVLRRAIISHIMQGIQRVYVDLSGVEYIDSAGLGLLVGIKMTCKKINSRLILIQPTKTVADILYISKLDGIFEFLAGAEAAEVKGRLATPENRHEQGQTPFASTVSEWSNNTSDSIFPDIRAVTGATPPGADNQDREAVEEYCRKAVEYMRQGNYELSIEEYRNALELDPNYLPALNNLAIVYEKQPQWYEQAIEQWNKVLHLSKERQDQKHMDRASRHIENLRKLQG